MMNPLFKSCLSFVLVCGWGLWAQDTGDLQLSDEPEVPSGAKLAYEQIARFTVAMEQIHDLYVKSGEEVSYDELIDGAIKGMMSNLDSYSQYMKSDTLKSLQETTQGAFGGVGIVINRSGDWITVVSPIEDSPGWNAGLMAGDQIRQIDGRSARGIRIEDAVNQLRGEPGTEVRVQIRRPSESKSFEVTLTRSEIKNPSVTGTRVLEDGIGYVRVSTFTRNTAQLLRRELTALKRKDVKGIVLDLRGNPGGLLGAAVDVAGLFLPQESLVVYTQSREPGERKDYFTSTAPHRLHPKLVILINGGSASASEVVSGALQDHERAILVGETSFGKASVQSIVPLPDGSALKLTTASYFTPKDRQIHERGIDPDEEVSLPLRRWFLLQEEIEEGDWTQDPQLMKAVELLRKEVKVEGDS
ncbi:S41 family peptidase [Kiritimatiellaeota bacterium B1221]|nr:S41 family peptidase [Kiritimatiellaeota bacterium B1221]